MNIFSDQKEIMRRIAIVGSGITGLSVAYQHPVKCSITLFDKSRKPGGRLSTRVSRENPGYSFDHGAPFVYAKPDLLDHLKKINAVKEVQIKMCQDLKFLNTIEKTFINGNPSIQTIPLRLVEDLKSKHEIKMQYNTRICEIEEKNKQQFSLLSQDSRVFGPFQQVYVCIPYPQCKTMKQKIVQFPVEKENLSNYTCTWIVMVGFNQKSQFTTKYKNIDVCMNVGQGIDNMVSQRSKGNSSEDDLWVFTMDKDWCRENLNLKPEVVEKQFATKISHLFGKQNQIKLLKAHRWLYSSPISAPDSPISAKNIVFGGDWVGQRQNIQQVWELGPYLYQTMNNKNSHL